MQREYETVSKQRKLELSQEDRRRILELSRDLPRVFHAETSTPQQRKTLLRLLLAQVTLSPVEVPVRSTRIQLLWHTGAVSELTVERPSTRPSKTSVAALERLRELFPQTSSDRELAGRLNGEGFRTGAERPWTRDAVRDVRVRLSMTRDEMGPPYNRYPDRRGDGLYSKHGVSERFGIAERTVSLWRKLGLLEVAAGGSYRGQPLWYRIDEATLARIEEYRAKEKRRIENQLIKARAARLASRRLAGSDR